MVKGLDTFRRYFADYEEQYVLIGGAACDILFESNEVNFRATRDLDMVLIVEALTPEFGEKFWKFIVDGRYRNKATNGVNPQFYRFDKPEDDKFPKMIELFCRSDFELKNAEGITPVHIDDEVSSLSAILLNDDYYHFLLDGRTVTDGISILDAEHIIPLKMKAWLDLKSKKAQGFHVNSRDIRKHRLDVFRLFPLIREDLRISVPSSVGEDIQNFIAQIRETDIRLTDIGISRSKDSILDIYNNMYIVD